MVHPATQAVGKPCFRPPLFFLSGAGRAVRREERPDDAKRMRRPTAHSCQLVTRPAHCRFERFQGVGFMSSRRKRGSRGAAHPRCMDARVRGHEVDDQITAPANRVRRSRRRPIAARRPPAGGRRCAGGAARGPRANAVNGVGRSLGVFLMENKHSIQPDFRQQFSRPRRKSPGVAPDGRRRGADAPRTAAEGGRGPPLRSGKHGARVWRAGNFRALAGNFSRGCREFCSCLETQRVGVKSRKIQNPRAKTASNTILDHSFP